jgi:hypothetical protein
MIRRFASVCLTCCSVLTLNLTGCGGGASDLPDLAPVTGTVTQGGQPLEGATVVFEPEKGAPSIGATDATGRYELYYHDLKGAIPGKHTVRISKLDGEAGPETVPARFNAQSTITKEVSATEPNDIKIEI